MNQKNKQNLISKPPVVVILGHVDHGKTSILDYIKKSKVAEKESGGITQHIGAYEIEHDGQKITFIDTPGHEAFSAMRSRGTKVADIAILVVDVCDGVKPQTKEAILEIKKSRTPMIIAMNKIDKIGADQERIKRELSQVDILVESLGGTIPSVETSAKTGQGIPSLLELILLIAEMEDIKTDVSDTAEGVVIESYLDNLRGPSATLLLNKGTLRVGDIVGTSFSAGKIRSMEDFQGIAIQEAGPSTPVKIIGFSDVPKVGDIFKAFSSLDKARAEIVLKKVRPAISPTINNKTEKVLNLILKTDCLGSAEVVEDILNKIPQDKIGLKILKSENGEVNESDIKLAKATNAWVLAFRVKTSLIAQNMANREKIRIAQFEVIYELVERVRSLMERALKPEIARIDLGKLKVLVDFITKKGRQVIGGKMIQGEIKKGVLIEVIRDENIVGKGKLISLQRDKKDIDRAKKGEDCGILFQGDVSIKEGDILAIYIQEKRKAEL